MFIKNWDQQLCFKDYLDGTSNELPLKKRRIVRNAELSETCYLQKEKQIRVFSIKMCESTVLECTQKKTFLKKKRYPWIGGAIYHRHKLIFKINSKM